MPSLDLMHRFIFDESDCRGEIVTLADSYCEILNNNPHLPQAVRECLGQFCVATTLISSTLSFDGIISLQAKGDGPISLIMVECDHHRALRAIVRIQEGASTIDLDAQRLPSLFGEGFLAITVEPDRGQRYQGIVTLEKDMLSDVLELYFQQSVQLRTRFWLNSANDTCAGLMLQALPAQKQSPDAFEETWVRLCCLADTVTAVELNELEHSQLLVRLFHEEKVRMFEPAAIHFACSCSRERSANALASLGKDEVEKLLKEQDPIQMDCKFCKRIYLFSDNDLNDLFGSSQQPLH